MSDVARRLYEAYSRQSGGIHYQGEPTRLPYPSWDELPATIHANWHAVVREMRLIVAEESLL